MKASDTQPLASTASFFNELSPENLHRIPELYAQEATFQDPVNRAEGHEQIKRVFADLFEQLKEVRMTVREFKGDDSSGFILWSMRYRFRGKDRKIEGSTHLRFNANQLIKSQTDYWDASFPVYGEFPGLGGILKAIRRLVRVKH